MPEKIVDILNAISAAKGAEFAEGFVAGVNLTTPDKKQTDEKSQPG
jgi:hypothetical protein